MPQFTIEKFTVAALHLNERHVGEIRYTDPQAAAEMGLVVERILRLAGEDSHSPEWITTIAAINAALEPRQ